MAADAEDLDLTGRHPEFGEVTLSSSWRPGSSTISITFARWSHIWPANTSMSRPVESIPIDIAVKAPSIVVDH